MYVISSYSLNLNQHNSIVSYSLMLFSTLNLFISLSDFDFPFWPGSTKHTKTW